MTQRHSGGGREQPQSIVGPITLDEPRITPVPVPPGGSVTPSSLGFAAVVAIQSAACDADVLTLGVACNAQPSRISITAPGAGSVPVSVPADATLAVITRNGADLVVTIESGGAQQPLLTVPVGTATVTVTVTSVRAI